MSINRRKYFLIHKSTGIRIVDSYISNYYPERNPVKYLPCTLIMFKDFKITKEKS